MAGMLESGNIYFFYSPRVNEEVVEGLEDVRRFYMILKPDDKDLYRMMIVGRKKLPEAGESKQRSWGYIEKVCHRPEEVREELAGKEYSTKTRGTQEQPAARPAGEGRYAISRHDGHTHLAYLLELPEHPGEVQEELNVEEEGNYILSIKNPQAPSPPGIGLRRGEKVNFPREVQERFQGRRFINDIEDTEPLNYEGVEFILIGAQEGVSEELSEALEAEEESQASADLFRELRLKRDSYVVEPLFEGHWQ